MELGTFGAVMAFAISMEEKAAAFHQAAAGRTGSTVFAETLRQARKRIRRLQRARREGVSEMILEAITGLDGDLYQVELDLATDESLLAEMAANIENTTARFYEDAAAKVPIPEIQRLFKRLARERRRKV